MPKGIPAPGPWDMPGDNANLENEGLAEGEHIFIRMGTIVRARRHRDPVPGLGRIHRCLHRRML